MQGFLLIVKLQLNVYNSDTSFADLNRFFCFFLNRLEYSRLGVLDWGYVFEHKVGFEE